MNLDHRTFVCLFPSELFKSLRGRLILVQLQVIYGCSTSTCSLEDVRGDQLPPVFVEFDAKDSIELN